MIPSAELSSLASALDELAGRLTRIADGLGGEEAEAVAPALWEVERSLRAAGRRLAKVVDTVS